MLSVAYSQVSGWQAGLIAPARPVFVLGCGAVLHSVVVPDEQGAGRSGVACTRLAARAGPAGSTWLLCTS